ncbi:MAG TPA: ABC transporter permease [Puia sp.]|jgi:predicted permease|nr:ABC transporter permease [Puia sp.]
MLKNYFRVAWRTLIASKTFSLINISGLALGIACSMLIFLWVNDELSVDRFHAHADRLYLMYENETTDGKMFSGYWTPGLLAQELKRKIPEVQYATGMMTHDRTNFEAANKRLKEDGMDADSDFFRMFTYPLLQGDATTALNTPSGIAISDKMAAQFFGSPDKAMGKTLRWENKRDFTVTAVFAEPPANSSAHFDYVINWSAELDDNPWLREWDNNSPSTAILLRPDADPKKVAAKLDHFLDQYNHSFTKNFRLDLAMQPYADAWLHGEFANGKIAGGRIGYVRLFSVIAIFILCIACINFMNLTTARSARRAREIGVRKVAGAVRGALLRQFLFEAVVVTAIAAGIALLIVTACLPQFNLLTERHIVMPWSHSAFWASFAALIFITGMLAGSYPAFFLSGLHPIRVLKGSLKFTGASILFRKGLVVFQFVLSIVLIIGTIVITRQINYIENADLGYNRDNLVYIPMEGDLGSKYGVFRQEAAQMPGVRNVAAIQDRPVHIGRDIVTSIDWSGKDPNSYTPFAVTAAGDDFIGTMQLQLLRGRDFHRDFPGDTSGYIVNQAAVALFHYKDPVGQPLKLWGRQGKIIGVVKDFHLTTLHQAIMPLVIRLRNPDDGGYILVRIDARHTRAVLDSLERLCTALNPQFPFTYYFTDDEYRKLYQSDVVVGHLSNGAAVLAIFISCLGLLGLAMFTAEQRIKEIGIRKVLGAGVFSLLTLLSGEFLVVVLIALVIASPLAWWAVHNWLRDYAYQIRIEWWYFGLAGAIAILIALLTVSFQALKAAFTNPVKSLRSE